MGYRVLYIVLFLALVLCWGCSNTSEPRDDRTSNLDNFLGTWVNEDEDTPGITRAVIRAEPDTIFVHMWGRCHPTDCDWGEETTNIDDANDNQLSLEWNHGFAITTQVVYCLEHGRLKVDSHDHYIDDSGRPDADYTYYFAKE
jgi:hypothetical protein